MQRRRPSRDGILAHKVTNKGHEISCRDGKYYDNYYEVALLALQCGRQNPSREVVRIGKKMKCVSGWTYMEPHTNDIRNIAFEKISERFSRGKYLGIEVTIDMTTWYINGNHLVSQERTKGGNPKRFDSWKRSKEAIGIINYISQVKGINSCDLMQQIVDVPNELKGTYVHQSIVPHLAHWASPRLAYILGEILNYIATNKILVPASVTWSDPRVEKSVGCVYFISDGSCIKIGSTCDLPKRLACLQRRVAPGYLMSSLVRLWSNMRPRSAICTRGWPISA